MGPVCHPIFAASVWSRCRPGVCSACSEKVAFLTMKCADLAVLAKAGPRFTAIVEESGHRVFVADFPECSWTIV